jgi:hypothetical protein
MRIRHGLRDVAAIVVAVFSEVFIVHPCWLIPMLVAHGIACDGIPYNPPSLDIWVSDGLLQLINTGD